MTFYAVSVLPKYKVGQAHTCIQVVQCHGCTDPGLRHKSGTRSSRKELHPETWKENT